MADITIKPGAATADAAQIDSIVSQITADMDTLNSAINRNIPDGVETTWSEEVKANWDHYYSSDIPDTMGQMALSASNLRQAVDDALSYSKQV
jgi:hypothetical protein